MKTRNAFTLVEIILSVGLMVIVGALVIRSINPAGQLAKARNNQRTSDLNAIGLWVRELTAENRTGVFPCAAGDIPTSSKKMASSGTSTYDIAPCIVPYLPAMPYDPSASGAYYTSVTDYDSGYYILKTSSTGVITLSAPSAQLGQTISVTR
ncbi:MAG: type II secretion system protein [Patescibacteria group bacterium]